MAFLTDTFTDTAGTPLESHAGETGAAWTRGSSAGDTGQLVITASGTVRPAAAGLACLYVASGTPPSPDYSVTGTLSIKSAVSGEQAGVVGRYNAATDNGYLALGLTGSGWALVKRVNGAGSILGPIVGAAPADGDQVALGMAGSTLTLSVNGSTLATQTDTDFAAAGLAGVELYAFQNAAPSDTTGTHMTSVTGVAAVTAPGVAPIAPNNVAWASSPATWVVGGTAAVSTDFGAKRTIAFTGSTTAALTFDLSALSAAGVSAGNDPVVRWSINGGVATDVPVASAVTLSTGLTAATTYALTYEFVRGDFTADAYGSPPVMAVRETGLLLDQGSTVSAPAGLPADLMVVAGDSITAGLAQTAITGSAGCDGGSTFGKALGDALNAQVGQAGHGGVGWAWAGLGNVPAFPTSWKMAYSGQPRTFPALKRYVVVMGTNDALNGVSDATVTSAVQAWLADARSTLGAACWVHVVVPFGGFKRSAIVAGITAYRAASPSDVRVGTADLGTAFQVGLGTTYEPGTLKAPFDGIHLSPLYHGRAGAALAVVIQATEDTATATAAQVATLAAVVDTINVNLSADRLAKLDGLTFTRPNRLDATAVTVSDKAGYGINPADPTAVAAATAAAEIVKVPRAGHLVTYNSSTGSTTNSITVV